MPSSFFGAFGFAGARFLFFAAGSGDANSSSVSSETDTRCNFVSQVAYDDRVSIKDLF